MDGTQDGHSKQYRSALWEAVTHLTYIARYAAPHVQEEWAEDEPVQITVTAGALRDMQEFLEDVRGNRARFLR